MHFLVFSGGDLNPGLAVTKALTKFDKILAVDSGSSHSEKFKLTPDFLVGDFDSIDKKVLSKLKTSKTKILKFPTDKDQTDTELGIKTAIKNGASEITILAGISGERTDHLIGNILLLLKKDFVGTKIKFVDGNQEIYIAKNQVQIEGKKGEFISFIPIAGEVNKLGSTGLKYKLDNYHLSIQGNQGISNELTANKATATFPNKTLLIIHTLNP